MSTGLRQNSPPCTVGSLHGDRLSNSWQIDQLQAKAEKREGDAKAKAEQHLAALRQKRDVVADKLKELSSATGNAWDQLKSGIDAAMEDLGDAYKKAAAEFSKS